MAACCTVELIQTAATIPVLSKKLQLAYSPFRQGALHLAFFATISSVGRFQDKF